MQLIANFRLVAVALIGPFLLGLSSATKAQDNPACPGCTAEQIKQINDAKAQKAINDAQKELLTSEKALRDAQVAAQTPATGASATPPTGALSGAEKLKFPMYIGALSAAKLIAERICNDTKTLGPFYVTQVNVADTVAKSVSLKMYATSLQGRLMKSKERATMLANGLAPSDKQVTKESTPEVEKASLASIALGIDVAAGLVKGVAGLAAFFKAERTVASSDDALSESDLAGLLGGCASKASITYLESNLELDNHIKRKDNELNAIEESSKAHNDALNSLGKAKERLTESISSREKRIADCKATTKQVKATAKEKCKSGEELDKELKELASEKSKLSPDLSQFETSSKALSAKVDSFLDAVYTPNTTTGISPAIDWAKLDFVKETAKAKKRLQVAILKSGGYTLTEKRFFGNDRLAVGGGASVRVTVFDTNGNPTFDKVYFQQTGWLPFGFETAGGSLPLSEGGSTNRAP
jgi:hypothetical protein